MLGRLLEASRIMLARRIVPFFALVAVPVLLAACPGNGGSDAGVHEASLVVGVQSEDFGGLVQAIHIVATVDGKVASDETVTGSVLPKEIVLTGASGARAEVVVEALTSQAATRGATPATPVVVRRAVRVCGVFAWGSRPRSEW